MGFRRRYQLRECFPGVKHLANTHSDTDSKPDPQSYCYSIPYANSGAYSYSNGVRRAYAEFFADGDGFANRISDTITRTVAITESEFHTHSWIEGVGADNLAKCTEFRGSKGRYHQPVA